MTRIPLKTFLLMSYWTKLESPRKFICKVWRCALRPAVLWSREHNQNRGWTPISTSSGCGKLTWIFWILAYVWWRRLECLCSSLMHIHFNSSSITLHCFTAETNREAARSNDVSQGMVHYFIKKLSASQPLLCFPEWSWWSRKVPLLSHSFFSLSFLSVSYLCWIQS